MPKMTSINATITIAGKDEKGKPLCKESVSFQSNTENEKIPGFNKPSPLKTVDRDDLSPEQRKIFDAFKELVTTLSNK